MVLVAEDRIVELLIMAHKINMLGCPEHERYPPSLYSLALFLEAEQGKLQKHLAIGQLGGGIEPVDRGCLYGT
jgi:hypothetical protein